jgi:hypothetical protein
MRKAAEGSAAERKTHSERDARMAPTPSPLPLSDFPPELIRAVAQDAARDADLVGAFLDALGLAPAGRRPQDPPLRLPADFLLGLGAALRLLLWEQHGIEAHREAGLPPARQAIQDVFLAATGQADPETAESARTLSCRVVALFVERFAWVGRVELAAELTLGPADEDALLEGLADFLWVHRPT